MKKPASSLKKPAGELQEHWGDDSDHDKAMAASNDGGDGHDDAPPPGQDYRPVSREQRHAFDRALQLPDHHPGALPQEAKHVWVSLKTPSEKHAFRNLLVPRDATFAFKLDFSSGAAVNQVKTHFHSHLRTKAVKGRSLTDMLGRLGSHEAINAGVERGDIKIKGRFYYMDYENETDTIGTKDLLEIKSGKEMSGKDIADILRDFDNACHYNWAIGSESEPEKVLKAPAAPDSKYMQRLQSGLDHIFAAVKDIKKLALDCKKTGRLSHGSIGVLITAALKIAEVLEKQHLEALSKMLYSVDAAEPCVDDIKRGLTNAYPIHKDLVLKISEIKSVLTMMKTQDARDIKHGQA